MEITIIKDDSRQFPYMVHVDGDYWKAKELLAIDGGYGVFSPTMYPFATSMWGAEKLVKRIIKNAHRPKQQGPKVIKTIHVDVIDQ